MLLRELSASHTDSKGILSKLILIAQFRFCCRCCCFRFVCFVFVFRCRLLSRLVQSFWLSLLIILHTWSLCKHCQPGPVKLFLLYCNISITFPCWVILLLVAHVLYSDNRFWVTFPSFGLCVCYVVTIFPDSVVLFLNFWLYTWNTSTTYWHK